MVISSKPGIWCYLKMALVCDIRSVFVSIKTVHLVAAIILTH